jgi:glycosyltransferase involved in cell wall biosynthesis
MRIVLLNQFYPPDLAPTGRYLHDLACALHARGHEVTVIASRHAYGGGGEFEAREQLNGVEVIRLGGTAFGRGSYVGRLADYTSYYGSLARELATTTRPELVVSLTTPPFLGLLAKLMAEVRGVRHAHWIMDVYPDALLAHGLLKPGLPYKALQAAARRAFAGASVVITLGPRMAERVLPYLSGDTRLAWVPLWTPIGMTPAPDEVAASLRAERDWEADRLVLLYSGNLGLGHRFDELLAAAELLGPSGPRWVFSGGGRGRPQIERFVSEHPELPVQLLPHASDTQLAAHLCSADLHLISVEPSWDGLIVPSKLQGSFAVERPVLFLGSPSSEIAQWVKESEAGFHVEPGDASKIAQIAASTPQSVLRELGHAAGRYARRAFDSRANLDRMLRMLLAEP